MPHKDSGFLVTCQTCLSSSNILGPQKLFVKIRMPPLPNCRLKERKLWSKGEVLSGETWVGFGQHRNEGTFGQPSSHHRHFAAGCFPAVSGLMQCRPPETTVVLSQHGLLSRPRPRESFSPNAFFSPCPKCPEEQTM